MENERPDLLAQRPNWEAIESSLIWKNQILPWLDEMRLDWLELRAGLLKLPAFNGEMPTLEEFHFWRGACFALKAVCDMPSEMIEANRSMAAQEKADASITERDLRVRNARRADL